MKKLQPGEFGKITVTPMENTANGRGRKMERDGKRFIDSTGKSRRPDFWRARVRGRGLDGLEFELSGRGTTEESARKDVESRKAQRRAPKHAEVQPSMTIADLVDRHMARLREAGQHNAGTITAYGVAAKNIKKGSLAALEVQQVTPDLVEGFLWSMLDKEKGTGEGKAKHAKKVLSGALDLAMRNGVLTYNPAKVAEPARLPKEVARQKRKERKGSFTAQELTAIREAADSEALAHRDLGDLVAVCASLGLRLGEALAIRWDDVDLKAGRFHEAGGWTIGRNSESRLVRKHHTGNKDYPRTMTLPDDLLARLVARRVAQPGNDLGALFPTPVRDKTRGGNAWREVSNTGKDLHKVFRAAGVEVPAGQCSHLFRHTWANDARKSVRLTVAEIEHHLGHKLGTMVDVYLDPASVSEAAVTLAAWREERDTSDAFGVDSGLKASEATPQKAQKAA